MTRGRLMGMSAADTAAATEPVLVFPDPAPADLVAEALGEHVHDWFLRNKRNEWAAYKSQVTQFELERYLPVW